MTSIPGGIAAQRSGMAIWRSLIVLRYGFHVKKNQCETDAPFGKSGAVYTLHRAGTGWNPHRIDQDFPE